MVPSVAALAEDAELIVAASKNHFEQLVALMALVLAISLEAAPVG